MPSFLEHNQRFPIVLDSDKDKPASERPTFFVRSLSMRDQVKLAEDMDTTLEHDKTVDIFEATCSLLTGYLVGWSNMSTFEFGKSDLRDFLGHGEARELLRKILSNQHVQPEEKKS